jgi:trk system potassium uptake protein TrkH
MNTGLVFNFLGKILIYFTFLYSIPIATAYLYSESVTPFLISVVVSITVGFTLHLIKPESDLFRYKEGFAIVGLGWLLISLMGAIPYVVVGTPVVDAFFESMSGFTTTGATIFDRVEDLPRSILLWRSMTEWIGGMGIIVLFVAVFPSIAKKGHALLQAEIPGITVSKLTPRLKDTAMVLWAVYLLFTVVEVVLLYIAGLDIFDSINHAFTTMSTGGFSTHTESIAYFKNPVVELIIGLFMFLAGMNFALHYYLLKGKLKFTKDPEFRFYLAILLLAIIFLTFLNFNGDVVESIRYSAFNAISVMTTTGYTTYDFDTWSDGARVILLMLMFVGGCSGSTAGGIKAIRIFLLAKYSVHQILKEAEPRTARVVKLGDETIKKDILDDVAAFFVLYVLIFAISTVLIVLSGLDMISSASAVAATMSNVGPGLGVVGASESYSALSPLVKLILIFNMWAGRLEIFTVFSLFIPSFWRERW